MAGVQFPTMEVLDAIERARLLREEDRLDDALKLLLECSNGIQDDGLDAERACSLGWSSWVLDPRP